MERICVVGMGTMGSQIGVVCARPYRSVIFVTF